MELVARYELWSRALCALAISLLISTHSFSSTAEDQIPLAEVPIELVNNRIQLTLQVGSQDLRFLMDTGASRTVLFQSEKHTFDEFPTLQETFVAFPALDEVVAGTTLVPVPIKFGDHEFIAEAPLLIGRHTPVGDRLSLKFDGILGQDFYKSYTVEVNPGTGTLRLHPVGTKIKKTFRTRLKLHMKGNAPHVRILSQLPWERRTKPKDLLIDTGYPGSMVIWKEKHFRQAAGFNNAKDLKAANIGIFTRATFDVGNLRFVEAPIFIAANEPVQASKRDGLIGSNVLSQFHYVIDLTSKRLWLSIIGVHKSGVDGGFYLPNNEGYIIRRFSRPDATPIIVIE